MAARANGIIEKHVDLNSRDGQEIASIVASLGESCGEK
jgi:hypothetical protein